MRPIAIVGSNSRSPAAMDCPTPAKPGSAAAFSPPPFLSHPTPARHSKCSCKPCSKKSNYPSVSSSHRDRSQPWTPSLPAASGPSRQSVSSIVVPFFRGAFFACEVVQQTPLSRDRTASRTDENTAILSTQSACFSRKAGIMPRAARQLAMHFPFLGGCG